VVEAEPPVRRGHLAALVRVTGFGAVAIKGLFLLAVVYTLHFGRPVLLPLVLAVLMTLVLSPAVRALRQLRIPEPLGAVSIVALLVAFVGFGAARLFDPANEWVGKIPNTLEQAERKLRGVKRSVEEVSKAADKVEQITSVTADPRSKASDAAPPRLSLMNRMLAGTQDVLVTAASTIVLLVFLLASGDTFLRKVVRMLPTLSDKKTAVEVARTIHTAMARYLFTITAINVALGVVTGAAMYFLGMPNPVLWGVMVAVFNYVPYVGPGVALCVLTLVAFLSFHDVHEILVVPSVFLCITIVEGQFVTPILTGRSLTLHPLIILVAMLFWGWMWGVVGALIAVPILMTFKIFCDHVEPLMPLGEFLDGKTPNGAAPDCAATSPTV
jgi:predicted PurR-regulated permease PerM